MAIRAGDKGSTLHFLAMAESGTPEQIVDVFVKVHAGRTQKHRIADPQTLKRLCRCFAENGGSCSQRSQNAVLKGDVAEVIGSYSR